MASAACEGGDLETEIAKVAAAASAVEQRTDAERQARLLQFHRMQQPPPPLPETRVAAAPWPMARADAHGRGRTALVGPSTGHVRWQLDVGAPVRAPAVTAGGSALAVGLADGRGVAVSLGGELRWSVALGAPASSSALALASGTVLFATEAGEVVALGADGALLWRTLVDAAGIVAAPVLTPQGRVAVGTLGGTLALLEPSGAIAWTRSLGGAVRVAPVVTDAGHLVVAAQGRGLSALDGAGAVLWSRRGPGPVRGALAIGAHGRILGTARGLALFAVEPDGVPAWEVRTRPSQPPEGGAYGGAVNVGSPVLGDFWELSAWDTAACTLVDPSCEKTVDCVAKGGAGASLTCCHDPAVCEVDTCVALSTCDRVAVETMGKEACGGACDDWTFTDPETGEETHYPQVCTTWDRCVPRYWQAFVCSWGLHDHRGQPKPAWAAFQEGSREFTGF